MAFELLEDLLKDTMLRHADQSNPEAERVKLKEGPPWAKGSASPKAFEAKYWSYSLGCADGVIRCQPLTFKKGALAQNETSCNHKKITIGTLEWKDVTVRVAEGDEPIPLPFDDRFLLGHYELPRGSMPESSSHHLWRIEFPIDRSVELVYGYGIDTAGDRTPQPLPLQTRGTTGKPEVATVADLRVLVCVSLVVCEPCAKVEPGEVLLAGKFFPLIMGRVNKPIAELTGAVMIDRPKTTSIPSDWLDSEGLMSGELFTDANDIVVNTRRGHFGEEINVEVRAFWGLAPTWGEAFSYYLIEPPKEKSYLLVRRSKEGEVRQQIGGVRRFIPLVLDAAQLIPPVPPAPPVGPKATTLNPLGPVVNLAGAVVPGAGALNASFLPIENFGRKGLSLLSMAIVASKGIVDLWDRYQESVVFKEPRQGEFDSIHLAPRFRYVRTQEEVDWTQSWLKWTGSHWKILRKEGEYLVPMAPICHCDCLHTHWRWSTVADVMHNRGWDGWGKPAAKSGAAMVPPNQEIWLDTIGGVDGASKRAYTTGFTYRVSAKPVTPEHWQVMFHHGSGISLALQPKNFVLNLISRQVGPEASHFLASVLADQAKREHPGLDEEQFEKFVEQDLKKKFDNLVETLRTADEYLVWPRAYFYQRYTISSGEERLVYRGGAAGLKRLCLAGSDPQLTLRSAKLKNKSWDRVDWWWQEEKDRLPDVYVRVLSQVDKTWQVVLDSAVRWNTLTPTWEQEVVSLVPDEEVLIEVWDCDAYIVNDKIGSQKLKLPAESTQLKLAFGDVEELVFDWEVPPLYNEIEGLRGQERADFWTKYKSVENDTTLAVRYLMLEGAVVKESETWGLGKLIKARRPDLLVDIYLPQGKKWALAFRSKVCANSFNPVWKEPTPVPAIDGQQFLVVVWDKDFGGLDYFGEELLTVDTKKNELTFEDIGFIKHLKFSIWNVWDRPPLKTHPKKGLLTDFKLPEVKLKLLNPARAMELAVNDAFDNFARNEREVRAQLQEKLKGWKKVLSDADHLRLMQLFNVETKSGKFAELVWGTLKRCNAQDGLGKKRLLDVLDAHDILLRELRVAHEPPINSGNKGSKAMFKTPSLAGFNKESHWRSASALWDYVENVEDYVQLIGLMHLANSRKNHPDQWRHVEWDHVSNVVYQLHAQGYVASRGSKGFNEARIRRPIFVTSGQARFQIKSARGKINDIQKRIYWQVRRTIDALDDYYRTDAWLATDQVPDREAMRKVVDAHRLDLLTVYLDRGLRSFGSDSPTGLGQPWHHDEGFWARWGLALTGLDEVIDQMERQDLSWPD